MKQSERYIRLMLKKKDRHHTKTQFNRLIRRYEKKIQISKSEKDVEKFKRKLCKWRSRLEYHLKCLDEEIENLMDYETIKEIRESEFFKNCSKMNNFLNKNEMYWKTEIDLIGITKSTFLLYRKKWIKQLHVINEIEKHISKNSEGLSHDQIARKYLKDWYVRAVLKRQTGIQDYLITDEMLKLKRDQIKIYRKLNSAKGILNGIA